MMRRPRAWWPLALRSTVEQQERDKLSMDWELNRACDAMEQYADQLDAQELHRQDLVRKLREVERERDRLRAGLVKVGADEVMRLTRDLAQQRRNNTALDDRLAAAEGRQVHGAVS